MVTIIRLATYSILTSHALLFSPCIVKKGLDLDRTAFDETKGSADNSEGSAKRDHSTASIYRYFRRKKSAMYRMSGGISSG